MSTNDAAPKDSWGFFIDPVDFAAAQSDGILGQPLAIARKQSKVQPRWKRQNGIPVYYALSGDRLVGANAFRVAEEDERFLAGAHRRVLPASHLQAVGLRAEDNDDVAYSVAAHQARAADPSRVVGRAKKLLASWGVPSSVAERYAAHGVSELYDWQIEALSVGGFCGFADADRRNMVYSAPTSGGKTLIAEILMLRALLKSDIKHIVFIVPFVSLCNEIVRHLKDVWKPLGLRIRGFYNNQGGSNLAAVDVAVATIERGNALINRYISEEGPDAVANNLMVVIDELHMVRDPNRGYLLEILAQKLRLIACGFQPPPVENHHERTSASRMDGVNEGLYSQRRSIAPNSIQIIAMSATLPNIQDLSRWLDAGLFVSTIRPIPLLERVYCNGILYDCNGAAVRAYSEVSMDTRVIAAAEAEDMLRKNVVHLGASSSSALVGVGSSTTASGSTVGPAGAGAASGVAAAGSAKPIPPEFHAIGIIAADIVTSPAAGVAVPALGSYAGDGAVATRIGHIGQHPGSFTSRGASTSSSSATADDGRVEDQLLPLSLRATAAHAYTVPTQPSLMIARICAENIASDGKVLVFCSFKSLTQNVASRLRSLITVYPAVAAESNDPIVINARQQLAADIEAVSVGEDVSALLSMIQAGVAYHNAGLSTQVRDLIENAFRDPSSCLRILCATSTLATGVNLPARTVIFRDSQDPGKYIPGSNLRNVAHYAATRYDTTSYKQMAGRAGRAGKETHGEVIIIADPEDKLQAPVQASVAAGMSAARAGIGAGSSAASNSGFRSGAAAGAPASAASVAAAALVRHSTSTGVQITQHPAVTAALVESKQLLEQRRRDRLLEEELARAAALAAAAVTDDDNDNDDGKEGEGYDGYGGDTGGTAAAYIASETGGDVGIPGDPQAAAGDSLPASIHLQFPSPPAMSIPAAASGCPPVYAAYHMMSGEMNHIRSVMGPGDGQLRLGARQSSGGLDGGAPKEVVNRDAMEVDAAVVVPAGAATTSASSSAAAAVPPPAPDGDAPTASTPASHIAPLRLAVLDLICCEILTNDDVGMLATATKHTLWFNQRLGLALDAGLPFATAVDAVTNEGVELMQDAIAYLVEEKFVQATAATASTSVPAATSTASPAAALAQPPPVSSLRPTQLGLAAFRSSMPPSESLECVKELEAVRAQGLMLDDELHLVFLCMPRRGNEIGEVLGHGNNAPEIRASHFRELWLDRDSPGCRLALRLGIALTPGQRSTASKVTQGRFVVALMLRSLINEEDVSEVARQWGVDTGRLQEKQRAAGMFAQQVKMLCRELHWDDLHTVLKGFAPRLDFGVQPDIVPLMAIDTLTPQRARALFDAGYRTVRHIAEVSSDRIDRVAQILGKHRLHNRASAAVSARLLHHYRTAAAVLVDKARELVRDEDNNLKPAGSAGHGVVRGSQNSGADSDDDENVGLAAHAASNINRGAERWTNKRQEMFGY